ncbi:MAG: hypothetical protein ABW006_14180 [Hyphomicrobium sp.]
MTKDEGSGRDLPREIRRTELGPSLQLRMSELKICPNIAERHVGSVPEADGSRQAVYSDRDGVLAKRLAKEAAIRSSTQCRQRRLQLGVAGGVWLIPPMSHGVRGTTRRTSIQAAGREDGHVERMAYLEPALVKQLRKSAVLPQRQVGHTADRIVGGEGDREAGAGRDAVVRPWIVRPRIAKRVDLGDQS